MSDIFVSYAHEDKERVRPIVEQLKLRWKVFMDENMPAGAEWPAYLAGVIDEARCMLVFWSSNAKESKWVKKEILYGLQRGIQNIAIVPVFIQAVPLKIELIDLQGIDLSEWNDDPLHPRFQKLLENIALILPQRVTESSGFDVAEIISLFENPKMVEAALDRAAREMTFKGGDRELFEKKRKDYSPGMRDEEKKRWIDDMIKFLTPYLDGQHALNIVHHFDKKKLKGTFDELRYSSGNLKILLIEKNNDPYSLELHEILFSYYKRINAKNAAAVGSIKNQAGWYLSLDKENTWTNKWIEFMVSEFDGLSGRVTSSSVVEAFNERKLGDSSYFVIQKIERFNAKNFNRYLRLWGRLNLEKPLFLFCYVDENISDYTPPAKHIIKWSCNIPDEVNGGDFNDFFDQYKNYYDRKSRFCEELCRCNPMSFLEALRRLNDYTLHY